MDDPLPSAVPPTPLAYARAIIRDEAAALVAAADLLDDSFTAAVRLVEACSGAVVVTGIGKAGLVARKIAATLSSTGTPSHFLHPAEALHGDLGVLRADDVVLALSQSGESEEIVRLLPHVVGRRVPIVAITGRRGSSLGRAATVVLATGAVREAGELGLAPSTSTTLLMALGDALALVVSSRRRFTAADFAARHPGGSLGRRLAMVDDAMRPLARCRTAAPQETVRAVFSRPLPSRRTGAVMILDGAGMLVGLFTDSDLARLFERTAAAAIDAPIASVMTARPTTIASGTRLDEAITLLDARKISELPVVDGAGHAVGLIDVVDLVGMVSPDHPAVTGWGAPHTAAA